MKIFKSIALLSVVLLSSVLWVSGVSAEECVYTELTMKYVGDVPSRATPQPEKMYPRSDGLVAYKPVTTPIIENGCKYDFLGWREKGKKIDRLAGVWLDGGTKTTIEGVWGKECGGDYSNVKEGENTDSDNISYTKYLKKPTCSKTDTDGGTTQGNGGTTQGNGGTTQGNGGTTQGNGGTTQGNGGTTQGNGGTTQGNGGTTQGNGGTTRDHKRLTLRGADLAITKTSSIPTNKPVKKGDMITYTLNYDNLGPAPAHDATIIDTLPEGTCLNVADFKTKLPTGMTATFFDKNKNIITTPQNIDCAARSFTLTRGTMSFPLGKVGENKNSFAGVMTGDVMNYSGLMMGGDLFANQISKPLFAYEKDDYQEGSIVSYFTGNDKHYVLSRRQTNVGDFVPEWFEIDPKTSKILTERHTVPLAVSGAHFSHRYHFTLGNEHYVKLFYTQKGTVSCYWAPMKLELGMIGKMNSCTRIGPGLGSIKDKNGNIHFFEQRDIIMGDPPLVYHYAMIDAQNKQVTKFIRNIGENVRGVFASFKSKNKQYIIVGKDILYFDEDDYTFSPVASFATKASTLSTMTLDDVTYIITDKIIYSFSNEQLTNLTDVSAYDVRYTFVFNNNIYIQVQGGRLYRFDPQSSTLIPSTDVFPFFDDIFQDDGITYGINAKGMYRIHNNMSVTSLGGNDFVPSLMIAIDGSPGEFYGNYEGKDVHIKIDPSKHQITMLGTGINIDQGSFSMNGYQYFPKMIENANGANKELYLTKRNSTTSQIEDVKIDTSTLTERIDTIDRIFVMGSDVYMEGRYIPKSNGWLNRALYEIDLQGERLIQINTQKAGGIHGIRHFTHNNDNYVLLKNISNDVSLHKLNSVRHSISGSIMSIALDSFYKMSDIFQINGVPYFMTSYRDVDYMKLYKIDFEAGKIVLMPARSLGKGKGKYVTMEGRHFVVTKDVVYEIHKDGKTSRLKKLQTDNWNYVQNIDNNPYLFRHSAYKIFPQWHKIQFDGLTGSYQTSATATESDFGGRRILSYDGEISEGADITATIYADDTYTGTPLMPKTSLSYGSIDISRIPATYKKIYIQYDFSRKDEAVESPVFRARSAMYAKKKIVNPPIIYKVQVTNDQATYDSVANFTNTAAITSSTTDPNKNNNTATIVNTKKTQTTPTPKPTLVVHNTEMTQGDKIDLRSLIDQATYTNGTDARAVVTVNSVGFDPNSPGVYTITYVLQEGNIFTQAKATVTVHKKSVNPNPNPNPNPGETMTAEKARIIAQNSVCKDKGTLIKKPFDGVVWRSFPIRTSQGEIYCRIDKKSKKVSIDGHGTGALIEPTLTVKRTATVVKGSSFDPRSLITKAVDQKGKDMTSEVIIDTDGLDTQKIGAYTVKYRLRVDGKFLRAESYIAVVEKSTTDPSNGTGSTKAFTTQYSLTDSKIFKKNDCPMGTFPSAVNYVTTATKTGTAPTETQADLLAKQAAELAVMKDILANGQTYANTHGKCTPKAQVGVVGLPHTGATR